MPIDIQISSADLPGELSVVIAGGIVLSRIVSLWLRLYFQERAEINRQKTARKLAEQGVPAVIRADAIRVLSADITQTAMLNDTDYNEPSAQRPTLVSRFGWLRVGGRRAVPRVEATGQEGLQGDSGGQ